MNTSIALVIASFLAVQACPPTPSPPAPLPDASIDASIEDAAPPTPIDAGAYLSACANLKALGCPEGSDNLCADRLRVGEEARQTEFDPPCLVAAKTKAAVRACGRHSVACP